MNRIYFGILVGFSFYLVGSDTSLFLDPDKQSEIIRQIDREDVVQDTMNRNFFNEEETGRHHNFITIGLGWNCHAAWYTRLHNIRAFAFPFDWCLTPYQAVYNFIDNDFKDYLKKEHLVPSSPSYWTAYQKDFFNRLCLLNVSGNSGWVLDKQSGMIYNHDFPNNSPATINEYHDSQYAKYWRRIERFFEQVNSNKHVYFIRYLDVTQAQACDLYQLIKKKFPQLTFTLIIVGDDKEQYGTSWGIPYIKNFYTQGSDEPFWQRLCHDIAAGNLKNA